MRLKVCRSLLLIWKDNLPNSTTMMNRLQLSLNVLSYDTKDKEDIWMRDGWGWWSSSLQAIHRKCLGKKRCKHSPTRMSNHFLSLGVFFITAQLLIQFLDSDWRSEIIILSKNGLNLLWFAANYCLLATYLFVITYARSVDCHKKLINVHQIRAQHDFCWCLLLFEQKSKTQRYSVHNHF